MRILVEPATVTRPDPVVLGSSLLVRVKLSPNVMHVKAGTPLTPTPLGWDIARPGSESVVILFATNVARGGELVNVAREVCIQLHARILVPGARYKVGDVDETGYSQFVPDGDGPYYALSDESLLLTPDI
jgi:hypothetical protein